MRSVSWLSPMITGWIAVGEGSRCQRVPARPSRNCATSCHNRLRRASPSLIKLRLVASAQASGAARSIRVELAPGELAWVEGEAFLLRRAIGNLLANALDFSPEGGLVRVELLQRSRGVDIVVRDQGPGIPDYADARVFEKFYSLARPHSNKKSTGLGLPFVKEIAELHHGRVALRNGDGGGAVATLSLPAIEAPPAA